MRAEQTIPTRQPRLPLPPYGKHATADSNLFIFAGPNAWDKAKQRKKGNAMVLPEGNEPASFRWPVHGLEIMLVWEDATREAVLEFGEYLIRSGASLVVAPFEGEPDGGFSFRCQS